jgi:hypothetical protein
MAPPIVQVPRDAEALRVPHGVGDNRLRRSKLPVGDAERPPGLSFPPQRLGSEDKEQLQRKGLADYPAEIGIWRHCKGAGQR